MEISRMNGLLKHFRYMYLYYGNWLAIISLYVLDLPKIVLVRGTHTRHSYCFSIIKPHAPKNQWNFSRHQAIYNKRILNYSFDSLLCFRNRAALLRKTYPGVWSYRPDRWCFSVWRGSMLATMAVRPPMTAAKTRAPSLIYGFTVSIAILTNSCSSIECWDTGYRFAFVEGIAGVAIIW